MAAIVLQQIPVESLVSPVVLCTCVFLLSGFPDFGFSVLLYYVQINALKNDLWCYYSYNYSHNGLMWISSTVTSVSDPCETKAQALTSRIFFTLGSVWCHCEWLVWSSSLAVNGSLLNLLLVRGSQWVESWLGSRTNTDTAYYCGFQGLADIYQFLYSYIVLVFFIFLSIFNSTPSLESHC